MKFAVKICIYTYHYYHYRSTLYSVNKQFRYSDNISTTFLTVFHFWTFLATSSTMMVSFLPVLQPWQTNALCRVFLSGRLTAPLVWDSPLKTEQTTMSVLKLNCFLLHLTQSSRRREIWPEQNDHQWPEWPTQCSGDLAPLPGLQSRFGYNFCY